VAVFWGYADVARMLLDGGADLGAVDKVRRMEE